MNSTNQLVNAAKIKVEFNLYVSTRTIRRHLGNIGMRYRNIPRKIFLTKVYKERRVALAEKWITTNHDWNKTIFSDEKRFTLDGPDNWLTYVYKDRRILRQRRQCKGGGVMVWLMVMPNGLLSYKFIEGKFSSNDYVDLLRTSAVPISKLNYGEDYFFQENNASVYKAKVVQKFMFKIFNFTDLQIIKYYLNK